MRICVVICTRQRPVMLRRCLESVCAQAIPEGVAAEIAVIENNAAPDMAGLVAEMAAATGWRIAHVLETELGLPFARTRGGVHAAEAGFDWALYIDDDEEARPGWLAAFVAAARAREAEAHYGPVVPVYPEGTPAWMTDGGSAGKRPDGAALKKAEGHNTLVAARVFAADGMALRFDPELRFTGGADTEFFGRLHDRGGRLRWAAEAVVDESVPATRMTLGWQLKRAFRVAISLAEVQARRKGRASASVKALARGVGRLCWALTLGPLRTLAALPDPERRARRAFETAKLAASALGSFAWFFGVRPQPYRAMDGG